MRYVDDDDYDGWGDEDDDDFVDVDDDLFEAQLEAAESIIDRNEDDEHSREGKTDDDPFGIGSE